MFRKKKKLVSDDDKIKELVKQYRETGQQVAYISGAYRSETLYGVVGNIRHAEKYAIEFWKRGYAVICPHKNTALLDGTCDDSVWLRGDLELLARSDVIVMIPGWENSEGAKIELEFAKQQGKSVIYATDSDVT